SALLLRFAFVGLIAICAMIAHADDVSLIPANSRWRYLDDGSDQGTAWRSTDFDDRGWKLGRSKFGYGDNNETTLIDYGTSTTLVNITNYFRRPVFVADVNRFSSLEMKLQRDDGAVVYANGVEVWRSNMPAGTITSATTASTAAASQAQEEKFTTATLSLGSLHNGTNIFAVEVHQFGPTSSDVGFNFELVGHTFSPVCPDEISFAALGDYGDSTDAAQDVADMINGWDPEFIVTMGDNNYPLGQQSTIDSHIGKYYHRFIYNYQGTYGEGAERPRFLPSLGNHDFYSGAGLAPYLAYFTLPGNERYYDYRIGPIHYFAIDSDDGEIDGNDKDSVQANWLQTKLAASDAPWKVIAMHHPPYCSGGEHGSSPELRWPYKEWGADIVLTGHDHLYERLSVEGINYIVNGTGGRELYALRSQQIPGSVFRDSSDHGAQRGVACDNFISISYYWRTGQMIDSFSIYRPRSPWKIDGLREDDLPPVDSTGLKIYARQQGDWLYLATTAFSGNDHFIYLARQPGDPVPAGWMKGGAVAQWDFFLGKERDNGSTGWYDAREYPCGEEPGFWSAAQEGEVLEGAINLRSVWGVIPDAVYVAVGAYASEDGGGLAPGSQVPAPDSGDGNIDGAEFLRLELVSFAPGGTNWIVK
ncbi:MAG TPA: metallophosphoesterase, partial [Candidatus Sumerlaeota bacterium]|nr:metallophosphoesterase [Candidatus Sumerlaeota bacterium]